MLLGIIMACHAHSESELDGCVCLYKVHCCDSRMTRDLHYCDSSVTQDGIVDHLIYFLEMRVFWNFKF
jgi:hypothetical protein